MPQIGCGFPNNMLLVQYGPTLQVDVGFDPTWIVNGPTPAAGITGVHALVDTGAQDCCIDNLLAATLNLPIVDRGQIAGSAGLHAVNIYMAQVHVPSLAWVMYGRFSGVDLAAGGQAHRVLMGRSFLIAFKLSYNGATGEVIISR